MRDNGEIFRKRLKALRLEHNGLSCTVLSELCGLEPGIVGKYERGDIKKPSMERVRALAEYLEVSTDYLIGLSDKR